MSKPPDQGTPLLEIHHEMVLEQGHFFSKFIMNYLEIEFINKKIFPYSHTPNLRRSATPLEPLPTMIQHNPPSHRYISYIHYIRYIRLYHTNPHLHKSNNTPVLQTWKVRKSAQSSKSADFKGLWDCPLNDFRYIRRMKERDGRGEGGEGRKEVNQQNNFLINKFNFMIIY